MPYRPYPHNPVLRFRAGGAGVVGCVAGGDMTPKEWHERYIARLVVKAEFTYREAEDICTDGEHSYEDNPEAAADEEMSYWREKE